MLIAYKAFAIFVAGILISSFNASNLSSLLFDIPLASASSPPVANAGPDQEVEENSTVTLDGTASYDTDGEIVSYSWTQVAGDNVTLFEADTDTPTFTTPAVGSEGATLTFELTVTDNDGLTSNNTDTVDIFVLNINQLPTANAGADQTVNEGTNVILNGSASSDPDSGDVLSYSWVQMIAANGTTPLVDMINNNTSSPSFVAPEVDANGAILTFELTVSDHDGLTSTDTVSVTVQNINQPPVADAGPDQVIEEGLVVILNGTGSIDADGDTLTYSWIQTAGPEVLLDSPDTQNPSFIAPQVINATNITLEFDLIVDDGFTNSTDSVTIIVQNVNKPPMANAGADQTVNEGGNVTLDGTGSSDPDGDLLAYSWTQTAGPAVTLSNANTTTPSFVAPNIAADDGVILTFELTVSDGVENSTDTVNIIINNVDVNQLPTADAGSDQEVDELTLVTLNGTGSNDPDGDTLVYSWTQIDGIPVELDDPSSPNPSFTAPEVNSPGNVLTFQLTVSDGNGGNATDTVDIIVNIVLVQPIADAGPDQTILEGSTVTLNGTGSYDPDGSILSFSWVQINGPLVELENTQSAVTSFIAPLVDIVGQTLTFELTVTDNDGQTSNDTISIIVNNLNVPPVAIAGTDQTVDEGNTVTLDGSASIDLDGDSLTYSWAQTAGPSVVLTGANTSKASFTAPEVGLTGSILTFELTVSDGNGGTASDTINISVNNLVGYHYSPSFSAAGSGTSYYDIPHHSSLSLEKFSLAAWFKTTKNYATATTKSVIANKGGFGSESAGKNMNYGIWVDYGSTHGNKIEAGFETSSGPDFFVRSPNTYNDGNWHYAVVTYDGSTLRLYIDGVQVTSISTTAIPDRTGGQPLRIGANSLTSDRYFTGEVDEVRLWNRAVTAEEIADQYSAGTFDPAGPTVYMDGETTFVTATVTANAGPDQVVDEGVVVTLDGTGSSGPDGASLSFSWKQIAGPAVTLSDTKSSRPSFTAPQVDSAGAVLTFELTVEDGSASSKDTVNITVNDVVVVEGGYKYSPSFIADGTSYSDIPHEPSLALQKFTLAAWFKTTKNYAPVSVKSVIANKGGFGSEDPGKNMNYGIWMENGSTNGNKVGGGFETSSGPDLFIMSPLTYNDGNWHYAVLTYDGAVLKLYIDNVLVASRSTTAIPDTLGTQPVRIGADALEGKRHFTGEIDEVRVWNRAVSDDEVADQYNKGIFSTSGLLVHMDGSGYGSVSTTQTNMEEYGPSYTLRGGNYFDVPDTSSLRLKKFSVASWFKTSAIFKTDAVIVNKGGFGPDTKGKNLNYGIWMDSAQRIKGGFESESGADIFVTSTGSYNDGLMHYAIITFDGSRLKLYIDGTEVASKSDSSTPDATGNQPLRIGANSLTSDRYFTGEVDEVRLWNRAVTAEEIADQYSKGIFSTSGQMLHINMSDVPIANAGTLQVVVENNQASLDGTASSDPDGTILTYSWTQLSGPSTTIKNANTAVATITAPDVSGEKSLVFQLAVSDSAYSAKDSVKIVAIDSGITNKILKTPDYMNDLATEIDKANTFVYVALYYVEPYSTNKAVNALERAVNRGVDVRLVFSPQTLDLYPDADDILTAKRIPYKVISNHAKVVVIDNKIAYVGSANWNKNGLQNNWELSMKTNNVATIAESYEYVNLLWSQGSKVVRQNDYYYERFVNGAEFYNLLLEHLRSSKSIKMLMFEMTYNFQDMQAVDSKVLNELRSAHQRGANLQIVLDDPRYYNKTATVKFLTQNNIPHKLDEKNSGHLERLHAKAFLFDDEILYIGSHNWSRDSLNSAEEASIITRNPQTVSDYLTIFNSQWSLARNP